MQVVKKIMIGSAIFFQNYKDFIPSDTDWLCLVSNSKSKYIALRTKIKNDDIMLYDENFTKDDFIREALETGLSLKVGKFLVPEFVEMFDVTIDDLSILSPLINKMDDLHQYEKIIYDAYMKNEDFILTDEQRLEAYESYKTSRIEAQQLKPMIITKMIRVGSYPFFGMLEGYVPSDEDYLLIVNNKPNTSENSVHVNRIHAILIDGQKTKEELIADSIKEKNANILGMYLVPEFIENYNITLEDLEHLRSIKERVMPGYKYLKTIYDAYIENGGFFLTDEQRLNAYGDYKATRKRRYNPLISLTKDALQRYNEQQVK